MKTDTKSRYCIKYVKHTQKRTMLSVFVHVVSSPWSYILWKGKDSNHGIWISDFTRIRGQEMLLSNFLYIQHLYIIYPTRLMHLVSTLPKGQWIMEGKTEQYKQNLTIINYGKQFKIQLYSFIVVRACKCIMKHLI